MGTRRADMSWQTTTRGLADRERRSDMAVDDSSGKAAAGSGVGGLSDRVYPADWATKTRRQKHRFKQRWRK